MRIGQRDDEGRKIATAVLPLRLVLGSMLPVIEIVAAASSSPSSSAPASPMKSRAGLKLCGRKPTQTPTSAAVMKVAAEKTLGGS